jgi:sporulation protein YabP
MYRHEVGSLLIYLKRYIFVYFFHDKGSRLLLPLVRYIERYIYEEAFLMEEKQQILKGHKLNIVARKNATITGVNDVLSFDAGEVLLQTEQGILMIRGNELHVNRLTLEKGEVDIDGRIDSLTYSETASGGKSGESLFGRLFK